MFGNYHGLPPMFAQVGSREILLDDTLRVARRARAQGVDFEVEVWDGMPHDWQLFPFIPEANQATSRIAKFFERCWSQPQSADVVPAEAVSRRASKTPSRRSKASPM